jgi:hypothetical protein
MSSSKTTIKRSSKKETVIEDVNLDGIEVPIDEKASELQKENELVKSALLGYGKADISLLNLIFGTWTMREIKEGHVSKLLNSFTHEGVQRYKEKNLIPIVVDKDDIDVSKLAKEPSAGGDVFPFVQFKREGRPILAAGGQHRRAVVMKQKESLWKQFTALQKAEGDTNDLKQKIKAAGLWGLAIYDKGK